jgi:hypothetical protein
MHHSEFISLPLTIHQLAVLMFSFPINQHGQRFQPMTGVSNFG